MRFKCYNIICKILKSIYGRGGQNLCNGFAPRPPPPFLHIFAKLKRGVQAKPH
nr:MAG TPA: hypothetical protein [Caudoviricetes sp.]